MNPDLRVNLERASVLLLDSNILGMSLLSQVFMGLGAKRLHKCFNVADAKALLQEEEIDLLVVNDELMGEPGYEVVSWLRRLPRTPNSFASAILVSGHTKRSLVQKTRDCGANFLVAKPISPGVMLERILWVSKEKRPFLETEDYMGPDRRFHAADEGDNRRRRRTDEKLELDPPGTLIGSSST